MLNFNIDDSKMRKTDRILVIKAKEGMKPLGNTGLADPRLFKGDNVLHAVMDEATCMWYMKYDKGVVPSVLKGKYTNFEKLFNDAKNYFEKRNLEIVEVKD
jgi:hypothetical protein